MIVTSPRNQKYDLVVIGSGPAGTTVAFEYARKNPSKSILVVEAGGESFQQSEQQKYAGTLRIRDEAATIAEDPHYLSGSRVRVLGGTSFHWSGWLRPLEAVAFEAGQWGFGYSEIRPFYQRALELLKCPQELSYFEKRASFQGSKMFDTVPYWVSPQPLRFGQEFKEFYSLTSNVDLVLETQLTGLRVDKSGSVQEAILEGKAGRLTARGSRFVLALGGVENAVFLLRNRARLPVSGVESPALGRFFMEHLHLDVGDIYLDNDFNWEPFNTYANQAEMSVISLSTAGAEKFKAGLQIDIDPIEVRTTEVFDSSQAVELMRDYYDGFKAKKLVRKRLRAILEHWPDQRSELSVKDGALQADIMLSRGMVSELREKLELLGRSLVKEGAGFIRLRGLEFSEETWPSYFSFYGFHHLGTTRIGATANEGVVDGDLRVHGSRNLYLAGSSVFRTGGYAPPTLTVVALAARLANHLGALQ